MLPKDRRIQRTLFSMVFERGKRLASEHFLVYVIKIEKNKPSQFAFSVPKKVCKRAVDRNRLRRQGYAVIGKHTKEISNGFLCIFVFKKSSSNTTFVDLEKEITSILSNFMLLSSK